MVVRFAMVHSDTGAVESGASYPGCSEANPEACKPLTFAKIEDAQFYCEQNGERLYVVGSALANTPEWASMTAKVWSFVTHPETIPAPPPDSHGNPTGGDNTLLYVGAGIAAFYFLS